MSKLNYFWVFQNQTFKEESKGAFLWAPQKHKSGRKVKHWSLMKEVKKGDVILHSVNQSIVAISFAKKDCYAAERPTGKGFDVWEKQGWRVDCDYHFLSQAIKTKDYIDQIMRLQPPKYSPINCKGKGNPGYLFQASKELFEFLIMKILEGQKTEEQGLAILNLMDEGYRYKQDGEQQSTPHKIAEAEYINEVEAAINDEQKTSIMDQPKEKAADTFSSNRKVYKRDPKVAANSILQANFRCEVDESHSFFLSHRTGKNYVEAHHLIPISCEDEFSVSLDVEANVICLCPVCHKLVHHGQKEQVEKMVTLLYEKRKRRLHATGIEIDHVEEILKVYEK